MGLTELAPVPLPSGGIKRPFEEIISDDSDRGPDKLMSELQAETQPDVAEHELVQHSPEGADRGMHTHKRQRLPTRKFVSVSVRHSSSPAAEAPSATHTNGCEPNHDSSASERASGSTDEESDNNGYQQQHDHHDNEKQ